MTDFVAEIALSLLLMSIKIFGSFFFLTKILNSPTILQALFQNKMVPSKMLSLVEKSPFFDLHSS